MFESAPSTQSSVTPDLIGGPWPVPVLQRAVRLAGKGPVMDPRFRGGDKAFAFEVLV